MEKWKRSGSALLIAIAIAGCASNGNDVTTQTATTPEETTATATVNETAPATPPIAIDPNNPLLAEWTGPYGGVPPFDQIKVEHFKPALETAMAENLAEVERIANDPAAPTFQNTIAAMENTARRLDRVGTAYGIWSSTMNGPEFQAVEREMAPKLAAFSDQITGNAKLFRRIEAVYNSPQKSSWTPEQQRLAWIYYTNFVRAGARLDDTAKKRLSEINQELANHFTTFSQNVLADETDQFLVIDNESDLAGLPQSLRDAASSAATAKGHPGKWVISNTRSSVDPFLTYSARRDLREKAWRMFVDRGDMGGQTDNNTTITNILRLRAERAKLLGYPTHAHWRL
ncbi:MAG TPA: M3 family metallopeptidase, partial [Thermoanaerobaculia bacterium]